ncbi:MAG: hypothetical protein KAH77_02255, partial [Thiomargarita sp.]|nr:hypothetical protein [Thiomargarita sp.]
MTRLSNEIAWVKQYLENIHNIISISLKALKQQEGTHSQQLVNSKNLLEHTKSRIWRKWVEAPQQKLRQDCYLYICWYQNHALLTDMQKILLEVQNRFTEWANAFQGVIQDLAVSHADRKHNAALEIIRREHQTPLSSRLLRLAKNSNALISCEPKDVNQNYDVEMQGYKEEMRELAVQDKGIRLAHQLLGNAHWEARVDDKGKPQLELRAQWGNQASSIQDLRTFHHTLYQYFRTVIDGKLVSIDIFDYLLYAQQQQATVPQDITTLLGERSSILLNAGQATQTTKFNWIYKAPTDPIKSNFIDVLQSKLTGAANPESNHSDPNSLTLLRTCFPTVNQISNLTQCQNAYISKQMDDLNDNAHHDKDLYRAQIYHPFRAELEAWNIERWYYHRLHQESITADKHISPRVTR